MAVRDEFQQMKPNEIEWYTKGFDVAKSEGWSVSQKEAIREQMRGFISDIVLELGSKGIHAKPVSKWIDYKTDMALAITKGEQ